jgi:hypothetical protein
LCLFRQGAAPPVAEGIANFVAKLLLAWGILFGGFYLFH